MLFTSQPTDSARAAGLLFKPYSKVFLTIGFDNLTLARAEAAEVSGEGVKFDERVGEIESSIGTTQVGDTGLKPFGSSFRHIYRRSIQLGKIAQSGLKLLNALGLRVYLTLGLA